MGAGFRLGVFDALGAGPATADELVMQRVRKTGPVPTVGLRGIEVFYELGGTGPRVLFLNGSGATLARVAPLLDQLRERFELLAHDQRGLGRTSVPDSPATMADYAADALALADHVGWERFGVVGISFGGMVAQELAAAAPERVERLALLCTSPGGAGGASYPLHELLDGGATPTILDSRFSPHWLAEHPVDRFIADGFVDGFTAPDPGFVLQLDARRQHDVFDRLHRISCPTFVAAGKWDGIAPPSNSEAIVSRVRSAELHVYDGGHLFIVQDEQAFPETLDFLDQLNTEQEGR
ncbi:MAG TPA: alpha/beta hydrolase [Microthrixaceae bacterium]|nr:alpha/beta hydrolase [Microthrixaceae bacterium]